MAIEWTQQDFWLNSDFTLAVVCDEALTGKTLEFVIRKEPEDATAVYSVTSGITLDTTTITDDTGLIPIGVATNSMEEGVYQGAIWRTDAGNQRVLAFGPLLARRAAAPP